jgi:Spy/CpxP family protein refolding chaperone
MVNIRSRVWMAGAAALLVAGLAGSVVAQPQGPRPGRPGMPGGMMGPRGMGPGGLPLRQLDLTEAQQSQVRDIVQRYEGDMREAGKKITEARETQRKAIESVPLNEGLVRSTTDALNNAQLEIALIQARIYNDTYNVLTDAQRQKLKELQARRDSRQQRRPGKPRA